MTEKDRVWHNTSEYSEVWRSMPSADRIAGNGREWSGTEPYGQQCARKGRNSPIWSEIAWYR